MSSAGITFIAEDGSVVHATTFRGLPIRPGMWRDLPYNTPRDELRAFKREIWEEHKARAVRAQAAVNEDAKREDKSEHDLSDEGETLVGVEDAEDEIKVDQDNAAESNDEESEEEETFVGVSGEPKEQPVSGFRQALAAIDWDALEREEKEETERKDAGKADKKEAKATEPKEVDDGMWDGIDWDAAFDAAEAERQQAEKENPKKRKAEELS